MTLFALKGLSPARRRAFTLIELMVVMFLLLLLAGLGALVVMNVCGLFLLQGAPFLMAASIIIYAGAIIVTFLFVLMLAQQRGFSDADDRTREPFLATFSGFVLLGVMLVVIDGTYPDLRRFDRLIAKADAGNFGGGDMVARGARAAVTIPAYKRGRPADSGGEFGLHCLGRIFGIGGILENL